MHDLFSRLFLMMISLFCALAVQAHNLNFGTFTISESVSAKNVFQLNFQVSGDRGSHAYAAIGVPESCQPINTQTKSDKIRKRISYTLRCQSEGIEGKKFQLIDMPPNSSILVRALRGEELIEEQMLPGETSFWMLNEDAEPHVFSSYIGLGVIHILVGWDHLLFLVMLMLLIPIGWKLVQVITAFTIGHSITLAMATVGLIQIPIAPVEALIALSIVFLGAEVIRYHRSKESTLTIAYPGVITALFGLFHGLGFASVLNDIGVPEDQLLLSLIGFNIGVELGQLLFVCVVLIGVKLIGRFKVSSIFSKTTVAYIGGAMGAFWLVERVAGF